MDKKNTPDITQELYPTKLELDIPIGENGLTKIDKYNYIHDASIKISIAIDNNTYPKSDVTRAISIACQKLHEYFR